MYKYKPASYLTLKRNNDLGSKILEAESTQVQAPFFQTFPLNVKIKWDEVMRPSFRSVKKKVLNGKHLKGSTTGFQLRNDLFCGEWHILQK